MNRIENPEINSCTYSQLIYDKGDKTEQCWKDSLFKNLCWENSTATCKKMTLGYYLVSHTKISSKWIKDLNDTLDTIKLLEENIGRALSNVNHSNIFFSPSPRVMEIKAKINKWNLIKLKKKKENKNFFTAKKTINTTKWQPQIGRKYL